MFRRLRQYLFENPSEIGLDNYLVLAICLIVSVAALLGSLINFILHLGTASIIATLIPAVLFAIIYAYSRKTKKYILSKYVLTILLLFLINIQWIINFGSYGPIQFLFVLVQSFVILLFVKWERIIFSLLIFLNVSLLFYFESKNPGLFGSYPENNDRLSDLYLGMLINLALFIILISNAIEFYIQQKKKAEEADHLKSAFLANMSHEIRTPMNAIIGFGQLLDESDVNPAQKKYLNILRENSFHLLNLIDDIIDISKIEANQITIINDEFSVNGLLESVKKIIQKYLENYKKQHLNLICNILPEDIILDADHTRIKQVITNLLSNATKFTEKGNITFGCELRQDEVLFYVEDTGIGIEKKNFGNIFERFGKIENQSNEQIFRGTGLGLTISKQLVELMNGSIGFDSEPGIGSRFYFSIPGKISKRSSNKPVISNKPTEYKFKGELILIAEDDDNSYSFLEEILNSKGLSAIRASNGAESVELCKTNPDIKLILMDIKMPKMDGIEAVKIIKEFLPDLPIIAQTAFAMETDLKKSLSAGCDDYISKPINTNLLLQKIKTLLT